MYTTSAYSTGFSLASLLTIIIPLAAVLALIIFIQVKIANNMARIAADKGYTERKWWHYVFWLGIIGILMICAMPDKNRQ